MARDRKDEIVEGNGLVQGEGEDFDLRDVGQAVLAPGDVFQRGEGQEIEHLAEGQGDHGEIDAAAADRQHADQACQKHRGDDPDGETAQEADIPGAAGQAPAVSTQAEIGGMAEGEDPRIPQKEIEAEAENAQIRISVARGVEMTKGSTARNRAYPRRCRPRLWCHIRYTVFCSLSFPSSWRFLLSSAFPEQPPGPISRMTAMQKYMETLEYSRRQGR